MAKVHVCNVVVLDNPSPFFNPFQFEVTFECIEDLKEGNLRLPYILKNKLLFVWMCLYMNDKQWYFYLLEV